MGNPHPSIAPYETLATKDGVIPVAIGNDRQFAEMAATLGRRHSAGAQSHPSLVDLDHAGVNLGHIDQSQPAELLLGAGKVERRPVGGPADQVHLNGDFPGCDRW